MSNPKIIVALDFSSEQEVLRLIERLDPHHCALKVGLEMFSAFGPSFVEKLVKKNFKVFLDLKFHDIPTTVARACQVCAKLGVWMMNLHASGGLDMMQAARESLEALNKEERPLLIAVTVLTSMNESDLFTLGVQNKLETQVKHLAQLTNSAQLDGIVCSALEVPTIKQACGKSFLTVTPGIRPEGTQKQDQQRVTTPWQAIELGSDFLVIGRPITQAQDPAKALDGILSSLDLSKSDKN